MASSRASVAQNFGGRFVERRKLTGEDRTRLGLDFRDQKAEDLVEQIDLRVAVAARVMHEQRGDALEHLGALGPRAMRDDIFKFGDE